MEIKVECSCGTRFAFEVEPVNGQMPDSIFCPKCGVDATAYANAIIQQNSGQPTPPASVRTSQSRLRVTAQTPSSTSTPPPVAESGEPIVFCARHPRKPATARCVACQKPICPECMRAFGYLCSVNCRYQAEQRGIAVPVYEGQRDVAGRNEWKKIGRASMGIAVGILALIGLWIWYAAWGSKPHPVYTTKFSDKDRPSIVRFLAKDKLLLMQQGRLALRDIKSDKDVWSVSLREGGNGEQNSSFDDEYFISTQTPIYLTKGALWVCSSKQLASFDPVTGTRKQTIPLPGSMAQFLPQENSLMVICRVDAERKSVMQVELPGGTTKTQELAVTPVEKEYVGEELPAGVSPTAAYLLRAELSSEEERKKALKKIFSEFIPTGANVAEMQVKLLQANVISVQAMKKPGKSVLNENTGVATGAAVVAEEIFNELKRNERGGTKEIDESRYQVTLRRLGVSGEPWSGEVTGPPAFYSQKTVDLLVAGKTLFIFDKQNKKLAEAKLTYAVDDAFVEHFDRFSPAFEDNGVLYFFDQGVLSAFELPSCSVRWRITTVGVRRVQPDGKGHLYIDTTSAAPEDIQYSEQIKISDKPVSVVMKVEASSGKILWKLPRATNCRLFGKYVYAMNQSAGGFPLANGLGEALGSFSDNEGNFRLFRVNPTSGKREWDYWHSGAPSDIDFYENRILVRYGDELQVLKYLTF